MANQIVFPDDLRGDSNITQTPFIQFSTHSEGWFKDYQIFMYPPKGFTIVDGATYNNYDTGLIEPIAQSFSELDPSKKDILKEKLMENFGPDKATNTAIIATIMARAGLGNQFTTDLAKYKLNQVGRAINPNTVLQYSNSTVRAFTFEFSMVPSNASESNNIKRIIDIFRESMYAEPVASQKLLYKYPALWTFEFKNPNGSRNEYYPKTADCYITGVTQINNPNGNAYYGNGAPNEVNFTIQMQEFKALNRQDIRNLRNGANVERRYDSEETVNNTVNNSNTTSSTNIPRPPLTQAGNNAPPVPLIFPEAGNGG